MELIPAICSMMIHFFVVAFATLVIYLAEPGSDLFSWHPTLMAVGCILLMMEAILVFSSTNSVIWRASRAQKVTFHWIVMSLFAVCTTIGFVIIVYNKYLEDKYHFVTWHAKFGLGTFIYMLLQLTFGTFVKFPKLMPWISAANCKFMHAMSGTVVFILTCVTICLAMYSNWMAKKVTPPVQLCLSFIPIAMSTTTIIQFFQNYKYRLK